MFKFTKRLDIIKNITSSNKEMKDFWNNSKLEKLDEVFNSMSDFFNLLIDDTKIDIKSITLLRRTVFDYLTVMLGIIPKATSSNVEKEIAEVYKDILLELDAEFIHSLENKYKRKFEDIVEELSREVTSLSEEVLAIPLSSEDQIMQLLKVIPEDKLKDFLSYNYGVTL